MASISARCARRRRTSRPSISSTAVRVSSVTSLPRGASAGEAGLQLMPPADGGLAQLPAKVHFAPLTLAQEVHQALVYALHLAPQVGHLLDQAIDLRCRFGQLLPRLVKLLLDHVSVRGYVVSVLLRLFLQLVVLRLTFLNLEEKVA